MKRTESYRNLYHGTDEESAKKIISEGFRFSEKEENWCGEGIYFYDIKAKAWWTANRTCGCIKKKHHKKIKPAVVSAEIVNLSRDEVFDLRSFKDLCDFEEFVRFCLAGITSVKDGDSKNEEEEKINLRGMLLDFYAHQMNMKLVVGAFWQRPQEEYENAADFADKWSIVFGFETIYCVKDSGIISNIKQTNI
ncbi:MAG: hypothetical protein LIO99_13545 [Clostridiales bacterium]|nr:hypothetical protein [Clostridiales bacterium]MCC8107000.1 hypothetical protein [Clostridiales bacterium]